MNSPQGEPAAREQEFDLFGEEIVDDSNDGDQTHLSNMPTIDEPEENPQRDNPPDQTDDDQEQPSKPKNQTPPWVDPNKPDLNPEQAAAHWKKRHRDASQYIKKLQDQYGGITPEQAQNLLALQNVISRSPELMNQVEAMLAGKQSQPQQSQEPEYEQPPEDFNPQEMYDPTTPSGKWYQRQEAKRLEHVESRILSGVQGMLQQRDQQSTRAQKELTRRREFESFVTQMKLTPEEAANFQHFVNQGPGRPIQLDDMYKFYQVVSNDEPGGQAPRSLNWDEIVEKGKQNAPPTRNPGAPQRKGQEEDFGKSLVESVKRRRITIN